jgi:hypothetical protein
MKIKANTSHVPRMLLNISKFLLISRETTKISMRTTKTVNMTAV